MSTDRTRIDGRRWLSVGVSGQTLVILGVG
jgi:hypothetical protein